MSELANSTENWAIETLDAVTRFGPSSAPAVPLVVLARGEALPGRPRPTCPIPGYGFGESPADGETRPIEL